MKLTQAQSVGAADARSNDVRSPCVGICVTFEYRGLRYCYACGRSVEEIGEWSKASNGRKSEIRQNANWRLANLPIA